MTVGGSYLVAKGLFHRACVFGGDADATTVLVVLLVKAFVEASVVKQSMCPVEG